MQGIKNNVDSLELKLKELGEELKQLNERLEEQEKHYEDLIYYEYIKVDDSEGLWGNQLHDLLTELIEKKGAKFIYQKLI